MRAVHAWLFQDVYEWAGRYRVVDVAKEGSVFAPHRNGIDAVLTAMARHNARVPWERLDRDDTVTCAATTIALLNYAHPFREGNGRTTKAFLERLTALGRFTMRWSAVTPRQWSTACAHAMPAPGTMRTRPGELRPALEQIIQPRDATTSSTRASRIPTLVMPPPDQRRPGPPGHPASCRATRPRRRHSSVLTTPRLAPLPRRPRAPRPRAMMGRPSLRRITPDTSRLFDGASIHRKEVRGLCASVRRATRLPGAQDSAGPRRGARSLARSQPSPGS